MRRFYLSEILVLANCDKDLRVVVKIDEETRVQLRWWQVALRVMRVGRAIPRWLGPRKAGVTALVCDTDAAGGGLCYDEKWKGVGGVLQRAWAVLWWPTLIRSEAKCQHCQCYWKRKMSFLEAIGWTMTLACFPDIVANREVTTRIDNQGSVTMWERGYDLRSVILMSNVIKSGMAYCRCRVVSCLLQQTQVLATALNTVSTVTKVTRCSGEGPILADHLSKGNLEEFHRLRPAGRKREERARPVPGPLLDWIKAPVVDHNLGRKILMWMRDNGTAPGVVLNREWVGGRTEEEAMDYFDIEV